MFIKYLEDHGAFAAGDVRACDDRTAMGEILSGAAVYDSGSTPASRTAETAAADAETHDERTGT